MNATATAPRRRTPLRAVNVRGRVVGGATWQDVLDRAAVLAIVGEDGTETPYWLAAIMDGRRCVGFRLRKLGGELTHTVSRDLTRCTCADATFAPGRPGGCRHRVALRQALAAFRRVS